MKALYQVIRGLIRLGQLDIYAFGSLKPVDNLSLKVYNFEALIEKVKAESGTFSERAAQVAEDLRVLHTASWRIRGNNHRPKEAQSALRNKNRGNRVLMIREPRNAYDPNALAVLVAQTKVSLGCASSEYDWVHVGYAPKEIAARAVQHWPSHEGQFLIAEGQLTSAPAHTAEPEFRLTGWRWY